jgi:hypothetical protein
MDDYYGEALKKAQLKKEIDQDKARDFTKGFQQPQTMSEGYENLKSELGSLFGSKKKQEG